MINILKINCCLLPLARIPQYSTYVLRQKNLASLLLFHFSKKKVTMTLLFKQDIVKYACLTVAQHCNVMTVLCIRIGMEHNSTSTNR